ncbi:MAG TPA: hypothetical protein V6D30_05340 [Leptolyngbyaceae cyanobacterium]
MWLSFQLDRRADSVPPEAERCVKKAPRYFVALLLPIKSIYSLSSLSINASASLTGEDAETRRHGDAESPRSTCDAGHEALFGVNVQGFLRRDQIKDLVA